MRAKAVIFFVAFSLVGIIFMSANTFAVDKKEVIESIPDIFVNMESLPSVLDGIKSPEIKDPQWLQDHKAAEAAAAAAAAAEQARRYLPVLPENGSGRVFTYDVSTRGAIIADLSEFRNQANQTLNDARGWARMSVSFQEVDGSGDFSLFLSEAGQVPSFYPSICSIYWSCQVGRYVIINQDRWLGASDAWNQAGGSLRDYRHMVINHETGHWLGHGHAYCSGVGQPASVMQQQSIDLQGCSFNPWPIDSELWSSRI